MRRVNAAASQVRNTALRRLLDALLLIATHPAVSQDATR
jgi:hypothetical protein